MLSLDVLVSAVPLEMVATMVDKSMAKEAWDAIATMRVSDDRVKKVAVQQLRSQFDRAMFREGETMEDFTLCLNGMVATLATLGEIVEEKKVVKKILRCVPPRLKQIALAISTLLDVESLTIANLAGRLKAAEEAFEEPPSAFQQDGKLYLTEEEWDVRRVRRDAEKQGPDGSGGSEGVSSPTGHGGHGSGDHGCGRGRGRGCGNGSHGPRKNDECRCYGKLGHWAYECKSKPKEQASDVHEEEASLMVAKVTIRQRSKEAGVLAAADAGAAQAAVEIHEERVFM
jgi:hypothetical protein